jgi:hypothetical protein
MKITEGRYGKPATDIPIYHLIKQNKRRENESRLWL